MSKIFLYFRRRLGVRQIGYDRIKAIEGCDGMGSNVYARVGLILQRMVNDMRNGKIGSHRFDRIR
jgi:hypothetical protein